MADILIDVQNATRVYTMGTRTLYALREVSLQIERGEFVAVVGPSGSGKSTLLNLVGGIDKPTSGQIWVDGTRIDVLDENALAIWRRTHIGIVFQFFQLLPTLTALENVTLPMELRGDNGRNRRKRAEGIITLLRELGDAGKTILLITHEANLARAAHRTLLMRDGQIVPEPLPTLASSP